MLMRPLFAFGDLVFDVVIRVEGGLEPDTDVPGEVRPGPGGSAANLAVWSARLGSKVRFAARVGDDLLGRALVADLRSEGVEPLVALDPVYPTPVLVLMAEGTQRHMVVPEGAQFQLSAADIPAEAVATSGWVHVTGYSLFREKPRTAAAKVLEIARQEQISVSFDPSSAGFIRRHGLAIPEGLRLLVPNLEEATELVGAGRPEALIRRLAPLAEIVALKLGPEGAILAWGDRVERVGPAALDGPVQDATGAGDSWAATFIHHLRAGTEPVEAARVANRLAAKVVTRLGARPRFDW
jgi:ribokinase